MRLMLRAGFDRFTGYGNDAVDLAMALEDRGVDVIPWPTSVLPGLPKKFLRLLEKDPYGQPDIAMTFAPPFDIKAREFAMFAEKAVGYSMWERCPITPADLRGKGWPGQQRRRFWSKPMLDERGRSFGLDHMIVTCQMNVEAFAAVDDQIPISVVPCGIDPKAWPLLDRPSDRPMRFGMIGMLNGRKDPFALITAWQEIKRDVPDFDAELWLHTLAPGLHPQIEEWCPDTTVTMRAMSPADLLQWYGNVDVLISTSRGEGNNKPAMEHMATGGTVIASDWGGHQNWLLPGVTWSVPGTLVQAHGNKDALEFAIDKEALKDAILDAWRDRGGTRNRGEKAHRWITESLSWEKVGGMMEAVLAKVMTS